MYVLLKTSACIITFGRMGVDGNDPSICGGRMGLVDPAAIAVGVGRVSNKRLDCTTSANIGYPANFPVPAAITL